MIRLVAAFFAVLVFHVNANGQGSSFGHAMLKEFSFPPEWTNLNQGSFGACPIPVQQSRMQYIQMMDANPESFFRVNFKGDGRTVYSDLIDEARRAVAKYVGADVNTIVLVENASSGLDVIIRSIGKFLRKGMGMLYLDTAYFSALEAFRYLAGALTEEPHSKELEVPMFPVTIEGLMPNISRQGILNQVRKELEVNGSKIQFCSFSHIVSVPGIILPIDDLIKACHNAGAFVLVDGAHAPGQIPLNLSAMMADFYVGDGHKWLFSAKGSAFIHVKPAVQKYIFPSVIEQGPDPTEMTKLFMWQGTTDMSALISMKDAVNWRERYGDHEIMQYMASLAEEGGSMLASMWGTQQMPADSSERKFMQAALANVRVPCGMDSEPSCPSDLSVQVVNDSQMYVPMGAYAGSGNGIWARVSASIYNDVSDFKRFGQAVLRILHKGSGTLSI